MRQTMLQELGGYNEELSYEDYDLWVRSGVKWKYAFQDEVLTEKRVLPNSHGKGFYKKRANRHLESTLKICQYALQQVSSAEEKEALSISIRYHLRQCIWMECPIDLVAAYLELLQALKRDKPSDTWLFQLSQLPLPWHWMYATYLGTSHK